MSKHRTYSKEFRLEAVKLAVSDERPIHEIAKNLGMPHQTLSMWVRKAKNEGLKSLDPDSRKGGVTTAADVMKDQQTIASLRRTIKRLETEKEILKKAMAFFMEQPR